MQERVPARERARRSLATFAVLSATAAGVALAACSSGGGGGPGDGGSSAPPPSGDAASLAAQLTTEVREGELEGWGCASENDEHFGYTFLAPGTMPNVDPALRLGLEFDPRVDTLDALERLFAYEWRTSGADSALLSDTAAGVEHEWTTIRFDADGTLEAYSSARGALRCWRGEVPR